MAGRVCGSLVAGGVVLGVLLGVPPRPVLVGASPAAVRVRAPAERVAVADPGPASGTAEPEPADPEPVWESGWSVGDARERRDGPAGWTSEQGPVSASDHRADPRSTVCTQEINDVAELAAAIARPARNEVVCLRGSRARSLASAVVDYARGQLGQPYRWGGRGRADGGFDCSGLTSAAYRAAGVRLPRTAQAQFDAGPPLPAGQPIRPGDLVFFGGGPRSVGHVGLAISATEMINAPDEGQVVSIGPIRRHDLVGATRPLGTG